MAHFLWGCTCGTVVDAAASKPTSVCVTEEAENMQVSDMLWWRLFCLATK